MLSAADNSSVGNRCQVMLKDVSNQNKADKELVVAAIQALKAKGWDVNPYTVADEAQLPRSTLYRNSELMELVAAERGIVDAEATVETLQRRVSELDEQLQEMGETIWNLEKRNEELTRERQDAWHSGYQAGHEEAARKYGARLSIEVASPLAAMPTEETAGASTETAPVSNPAPAHSSGVAASTAPVHTAPSQVITGQLPLSSQPTQPAMEVESAAGAQGTAQVPIQPPATAEGAAPNGSAERGYTPLEHVQLFAGIDESMVSYQQKPSNERPTSRSDTADIDARAIRAQEQLSAATRTATQASTTPPMNQPADSTVYNLAKAGPYVSSDFNPLLELSWRDVETVYNFSVSSLADMANRIPDPRSTGSNIASIQPPPVPKPPGALPPEQLYTKEQHFAKQGSWQPSMTRGQSPTPQELLADLQQSSLDTAPEEPSARKPAARQDSSQPEYDNFSHEGVVSRDGKRFTSFNQAGESLIDPRNFSGSEAVVDLDALDIFEDLDEYIDLEQLDTPDREGDDNEGDTAGDELRELIKGRIMQASQMPNEPTVAHAMGSGSAQPESPPKGATPSAAQAGGLGRSKFVGSKAAQQAGPTAEGSPAPAASAGTGTGPTPTGQTAGPTPTTSAVQGTFVRQVPPEIRKACLILGIRPEDMTQQSVIEAWKRQITTPGVHPDLGGDHEAAICLNTAKDQLVRWLDQQAPKLGKKFGSSAQKESRTPQPGSQK